MENTSTEEGWTLATFKLITAAIGRADRNQALSLASEALQRGDDQPLVLMLAAEQLEQQGDTMGALQLLKRAVDREQDEPELWRRYGQLLAQHGRWAEGLEAFDEALDIDPQNRLVVLAAGEASYRAGSLRRALDYYRRADDMLPEQSEVVSAIAAIYAGLQDSARAREFGERALRWTDNSVNAHMAIARADLLDGNPARALNRVIPLLQTQTIARIALLDIAAEASDALDRPPEAFDFYAERNSFLDRAYLPKMQAESAERRVDQARRITRWLNALEPDDWPVSHSRPKTAGHAFILGFPRSGTTLLEKGLAGHPKIVTLPEIDLLSNCVSEFLQSDEGMDRLSGLTNDQLEVLRDRYWDEADRMLGGNLANKVVVDKMPLHTLALPLINRLFPSASIVFAIRDPRDVVLSCFRRRFQINSAMYEFLSLERAAKFYDAVMHLAEVAVTVLPMNLLQVRHEAVVANFDGELGKLLAFMHLEWDEAVRGFDERAKAAPRTPSDLQLRKGLNRNGVDQWKRYADQLLPVMPIVDRWVARFNYSTR